MNSIEWILYFLPFAALSFYLFETLLKRMEKKDPLKFANLGTSDGGLLPSSIYSSSDLTKKRYLTGKLALKWFFKIPRWMKNQKDNTLTILWIYKISSFMWFVAVIVWGAVYVYRSWF